MSPLETNWLPALITLSSGLIVGAALAWTNRRMAASMAPATRSANLRELEAMRDSLVERLQESDDNVPTATRQQRARERYAREVEAATVLRAIEVATHERATVPRTMAAAPPPSVMNVIGGIAFAGVIGALLCLVSATADQRLPAARVTSQTEAQLTSHPDVTALDARVRDNPDDFAARLTLAQAYLIAKNLVGTYEQTQYVLERQPEHPVALTYGAIVRLAMGEADEALGMLERAVARRPDLLEAWAYKALALARTGRPADAAQVIHDAEQRFPERRGPLETLLAQIRGGPPPAIAGRADVTRQAGDRVSGVIELDRARRVEVRYPVVLFVSVRAEHATVGPPLAVLRLEVNAFPVAFSVGSENAMTPAGRLPPRVRVEARIDPDGDATTRESDAPHGFLDGVAVGSFGQRLLVR